MCVRICGVCARVCIVVFVGFKGNIKVPIRSGPVMLGENHIREENKKTIQ